MSPEMMIKTMGIDEAAEFIRVHPVTLSKMAHEGEIPAAKPGKEWVFINIDLVEWLRSKYKTQASVSDQTKRTNKCHSTNVKIQLPGGTNSKAQMGNGYKELLGLK